MESPGPHLSNAIVGDMSPRHQRGLQRWAELLEDRHDEMRAIFAEMDANGDGFLDREELHACALALGKQLTEEELDELFSVEEEGMVRYAERVDMDRAAAETYAMKMSLLAAGDNDPEPPEVLDTAAAGEAARHDEDEDGSTSHDEDGGAPAVSSAPVGNLPLLPPAHPGVGLDDVRPPPPNQPTTRATHTLPGHHAIPCPH